MNKRAICPSILLLVLCCILLGGCSQKETPKGTGPLRDTTPKVLIPEASGTVCFGTELVSLDASHTDQGYLMVQYHGANPKVKLQLDAPDGTRYLYLLSQSGSYETFPFSSGNGIYSVSILENAGGDMYSIAFSQDIEVAIADEFTPFLYPNQYVWFTADSQAVIKGQELAENTRSDLEVVANAYHFVIENITYDDAKAESVSYGYLPSVDETLQSKKGICFDYASLMSAMLRSQGIPTRLEVGYVGELYHAWISTYVDDKGWVDKIIQFDGTSWSMMDPTFAANNSSPMFKDSIQGETDYLIKYSY